MDISDRIKNLRIQLNLSQTELAKKIGVSAGNIGDWESGRSKPTSNALIAFMDNFGISTNWLLTGEGELYIDKSVNPDTIPNTGEVVLMAKGYGGKSEIITLSEEDYEFAKSLFERFRREYEAEKGTPKKRK